MSVRFNFLTRIGNYTSKAGRKANQAVSQAKRAGAKNIYQRNFKKDIGLQMDMPNLSAITILIKKNGINMQKDSMKACVMSLPRKEKIGITKYFSDAKDNLLVKKDLLKERMPNAGFFYKTEEEIQRFYKNIKQKSIYKKLIIDEDKYYKFIKYAPDGNIMYYFEKAPGRLSVEKNIGGVKYEYPIK